MPNNLDALNAIAAAAQDQEAKRGMGRAPASDEMSGICPTCGHQFDDADKIQEGDPDAVQDLKKALAPAGQLLKR